MLDNLFLRVTMPDGSKWDVPVNVIAKDRAEYYAKHDGVSFEEAMTEDTAPLFLEDEYEIEDWAANNMDWSDVAPFAVRVPDEGCTGSYQEGWVNGDKEVVKKDA